MDKPVKTENLLRTLSDLGFISERRGAHLILRHEQSETLVTLPAEEIDVAPIFLKTIARQVSNTGIMTADAFANRLERQDVRVPEPS